MVVGQGSTAATLSDDTVQQLLGRGLDSLPVDGKRVLVIIPDSTRTAPIPLLFDLMYKQIGRRVARLDYLIALGTHPPMSGEAIERLVGVSAAERTERYPNVTIFNHRWDLPEALQTIGIISREETAGLTDGLLADDVLVVLNRLIFDYDQLNILSLPHTFRRVLSMPAPIYDDLWTAAKAMYKTEPIIADGGEVIIYAPHISEISYTHGQLIDEVGYHVRDYFLKQWERFKHIPGGILAHSTHVRCGMLDAPTDWLVALGYPPVAECAATALALAA